TADDLIATAFHRNTQTNTEGGTDDEEFRVAAVIDRVNTTWTVWQATTFGCVQCHSHPYDPIKHEEYYRFMSLFDSSIDADLPSDFPTLTIPNDEASLANAVDRQRTHWDLRRQTNQAGWKVATQVTWNPLIPRKVRSTGGHLDQNGELIEAKGGTFPVGVRYVIEFGGDKMGTDAGEADATFTALKLDILPTGKPESGPDVGALLTHLTVELIPEDHASFEDAPSPESDEQQQVTRLVPTDVFVDSILGPMPRWSVLEDDPKGVGEHPKLTGPRSVVFVFERPSNMSKKTLRLTMKQSGQTTGNLATPIRKFRWSKSSDTRLPEFVRDDSYRTRVDQQQQLRRKIDGLAGAKLPIMQTRPQESGRKTQVFIRGNWLERGAPVAPGIPKIFRSTGNGSTAQLGGLDQIEDRLSFAKWLVSVKNPLAARVWANRVWAQLFGVGLVETQEDFGSSGTPAFHPRLLDHLAIRLRDKHAWHLKPFLRDLVMSRTYRQDHSMTPSSVSNDPRNRWLARGPRTRLTAEMVRDQALALSGLLDRAVGGPSVMPPQPDGVWQTVYNARSWKNAEGGNRYRRGVYTYWRRTSPYPSFLTFDAPTRDLCSARRIATNTPLQALVTLNDPVYVECGESMARQVVASHPESDGEALVATMLRWITQQPPTSRQVDILTQLYSQLKSTPDFEQTTTTQGHPEPRLGEVDLEALAIVANTILNADAALTK
ncbi:MAG: DUF1553 domain-containing protein, partial [Planctomycetota bacterium]